MIAVSACLLGINCRYDGRSRFHEILSLPVFKKLLLPLCPEQLGGLPTPRAPAEICGGDGWDVVEGRAKVISSQGIDVTDCFLRGAQGALRLITRMDVSTAIMTENSPSCGVFCIKKNGALCNGSGVTSALLKRNNIRVIPSDTIEKELRNIIVGI